MASKETDQPLSSNGEMKVEISFRKISKNAICFHIWKIDEDHIEAEVKGNYGTFVDDGAYIIYASSPVGIYIHQDTLTRELKLNGSLERFIHIWFGEYVNEKKRAFVIQKVQELDSYFGNIATIYRESQNYESSRFLSYFKKGLIIKSSLLINSTDTNRLYQIRGRRCLRCTEMKTISWEHFSAYYIMMLQTAERLYLWFGRSSSNVERRNSIDMAGKYEKDMKNIIIVDDGYEQSLPEQWRNEWNQFLPLNHRVVCQSVSQSEKDSPINMKIYKCCYRNNRLHMDQLDVLKPTKEDLSDSATVYVLDTQMNSLWLWVGNLTTQEEKNTALGNGRAFVKKKKYPYYTTITRVVENYEPIEFKRLFTDWKIDNGESTTSLKSIPTILSRVDSMILSERPKMAAETQLIDDGSGARQIYRITKDEVLEIPQQKASYFITHYAYVVAYMVTNLTTTINNDADRQQGVERVIYQWNGLEATAEVNAKAEKYARSLFDAAGSKCMLVQMRELDETPHFLQVFRGKLIILLKDKLLPHGISNNNNDNNNNNNIANKNLQTEDKAVKFSKFCNSSFMLKVTGDSTYNTKAVEISNLNVLQSKDCYVVNSNGVWVWCGQSSTGDSREMAKNVGLTLGESTLVLEHKEPEEFWQSIRLINSNFERKEQTNGGCSTPITSTTSQLSASSNSSTNSKSLLSGLAKNPFDIQLFLVWTQRGKHFTQDIVGFEQSDLSPECVYILDAGRITYIWLGNNAYIYEKERYMSMVQTYLERIALQRKPSSAVAVIRQHDEPNIFKGFFNTWDNDYWDSYINYESKRQLMSNTSCDTYSSGNVNNQLESPQLNGSKMLPVLLNNQKDFDRHQKFPIHILQQEIDFLPPDINPLKREVHLTHDDFVSLFKISYWEFEELPNWKKQELKKKHKLF